MNLPELKNTMSSREIAELTGKPHNDLLKSIRSMESAWEKVCKGKFSLTYYDTKLPKGGTRKDPEYLLTKTECLYIATKFNDEARARLILRWEELETKQRPAPPSSSKVSPENSVSYNTCVILNQLVEEESGIKSQIKIKAEELATLNSNLSKVEQKKSILQNILSIEKGSTAIQIVSEHMPTPDWRIDFIKTYGKSTLDHIERYIHEWCNLEAIRVNVFNNMYSLPLLSKTKYLDAIEEYCANNNLYFCRGKFMMRDKKYGRFRLFSRF